MVFRRILVVFLCVQICISTNTSETTTPIPNDVWVPRVISGFPAKLGDAPYQVALKNRINRITQAYKTFCGSALIGPTKLLTAAHCFEVKGLLFKFLRPGRVPPEVFKGKYAVAGNLDNVAIYSREDGPRGQWRALHSVHRPPSFKFPEHDIAVAFTQRPFVYNQFVSPIGMASRNTDYTGKCLVSGYGRIGPLKSNQSDILLLAHLEIMPKKICTNVHRKNMDRYVCSASSLSDVAKGDSGSPLVCSNTGDPHESVKGVLVGIVSGHAKDKGSFHTRISRYMNFITKSGTNAISVSKYNIVMLVVIAIININSILVLC